MNTFIISQYRFKMDKAHEDLLEKFNQIFTGIFFVEMVIMLTGLGFKEYIKDNFKIFDALVVFVSIIEIAIQQFMIRDEYAKSKAISAIRAFRLLRILKLAKTWKQL